MKIENPHTNVNLAVGPTGADQLIRTAQKSGSAMGSDSVRLSSDLQLANLAMKAVEEAGAIRPDAVARGRALVERGDLGNDLEGLADSIIDALANSHDDNPT